MATQRNVNAGSFVSNEIMDLFIKQTKDFMVDFVAGAAGGAVCVAVGQPLDTVKVKLQTFPNIYSGMTRCFYQTWKNDGLTGLYAGTVPSLIANVAENSVLFGAYCMCQKAVALGVNKSRIEDLTALENATSGFCAAFFSSFALCPTELVKCRLQAMRELSSNSANRNAKPFKITALNLTATIMKNEGVLGLFRGLTSTMAREMPGYFFFFGGYETSKSFLARNRQSKENLSLIETGFCGGIAGTSLWVAIFPTDVIKSRIQVSGSKDSMTKVYKMIVRNEGYRALYNGFGTCVLRSFPATAVLFIVYEATKKYLQDMIC